MTEFGPKLVWDRERQFVREKFADIEPGKTEWLVKNFLPASGLAILYGASTVGKSFVALYFCLRIARGQNILNHKARKSGVLYIAAEGQNGMRKRIKGLREHFSIDAPAFQLIGKAPNLLDEGLMDDLARECADADAEMMEEAGVGLGLIVVDTTSASLPGGNENTSETMSLALTNAAKLGHQTGALVLLVSHPGKDEGLGVRGWSGQKGNTDAIIYITKGDESDPGQRIGRVEKLKDGQDGETFAYRLKEIDLGFDADGDPITTAYPVFEDAPPPKTKGRQRAEDRPGPKIVLRALGLLQEVGQTYVVPPLPGVPPNTAGVMRTDLRERAAKLGHPAADLRADSAKRMINKDIAALIAERVLRAEDDLIWKVR